MEQQTPPLLVAITGASGVVYGVRLLEALRYADVQAHLIISEWAERTLVAETNHKPADVRALADFVYADDDLSSAPASGAFATEGMIVAPCSMKSLAAITHGVSGGLIQRAAEVTLKEHRKLLLLVREAPLSVIHLDNMLAVARAGALIVPPVPAFYSRPQSIEDIIDHTVGRVLDCFGIDHQLVRRWGDRRGQRSPSERTDGPVPREA